MCQEDTRNAGVEGEGLKKKNPDQEKFSGSRKNFSGSKKNLSKNNSN